MPSLKGTLMRGDGDVSRTMLPMTAGRLLLGDRRRRRSVLFVHHPDYNDWVDETVARLQRFHTDVWSIDDCFDYATSGDRTMEADATLCRVGYRFSSLFYDFADDNIMHAIMTIRFRIP